MLIIEKIIDVETNTEQIIERQETEQERQEREAAIAEFAQKQSDEAIKAQQKAIILERLGLTEEEAKLLLG